VIVFAVALAIIQYVDKVCMSQAAPSVQRDLHLNKQDMGWVFGAFTLAYALFEIPAGYLGDRFGPGKVLLRIVVWWSFCTAVIGRMWSWGSLVIVQFLFGAGEAGAFPNLTKAFNRRFLETYLDEEIERARRYSSTCSIIFLDLDDLKTVNNAHGHLAGSRTLQEVAKRILAAVRGIDKVVRFGGDEFCIILPQTDQEQAVAVAHRVRRAMISAPFHLGDGIDISISASFGIATFPTHGTQKDDLIRQADAAMYRVKSTTKNAVGVAIVGDEQATSRA
jgi:diguanylate cyclase (GGDEF)-like protein